MSKLNCPPKVRQKTFGGISIGGYLSFVESVFGYTFCGLSDTALNGDIKRIVEKPEMIIAILPKKQTNEDSSLYEEMVLAVAARCAVSHLTD